MLYRELDNKISSYVTNDRRKVTRGDEIGSNERGVCGEAGSAEGGST